MKKYIFAALTSFLLVTSCQKDKTIENPLQLKDIAATKGNSPVNLNLNKDLIAFYPFNGNAQDLSGNGNHGTVFQAIPTNDRFGKKNRAYYFNGQTSYIKCIYAGPTGNPQVSVSFWLKKTADNTDGYIVGWGNDGTSGNDFRIAMGAGCSNTIAFDTWDNILAYNTSLPIGEWNHYTVTYDGVKGPYVTSATIYKNGIMLTDRCSYYVNIFPTNISNTNPIVIGKYHGTAQAGYITGAIDDIRIYDRILSANEIKFLASN